jgi:hypothetical protein
MSSNAIQDYVVAATKGRDELLSIQSKIPRDAVDGIVDETPLRETAGVVHRLQDQATKSADSSSTPSHHALYTAVEVLGDKWEQFVESVLDAFPEDSTTRIIDAELELNQAIVNVHSLIPDNQRPLPNRDDPSRLFWDEASCEARALMTFLINAVDGHVRREDFENVKDGFRKIPPSSEATRKAIDRLNTLLLETANGWEVRRSQNLDRADAKVWLIRPGQN